MYCATAVGGKKQFYEGWIEMEHVSIAELLALNVPRDLSVREQYHSESRGWMSTIESNRKPELLPFIDVLRNT